jgi:hypothetical protein
MATVTADETVLRKGATCPQAKVFIEVFLPPGTPEERRFMVERYAEAAVRAIAERAGRDE